jgi:hypothetical protein
MKNNKNRANQFKKYLVKLIMLMGLTFTVFNTQSLAATNGYSFDGGDYASMSSIVSDLNGASAMSMSFWAKFTDSTKANCFFGHTGGKLYFCFDGDGSIGASGKLITGQNSGAHANISTNTYSFIDETWYHLVVVYNASDWSIYVNGTSIALDKIPFELTLTGLSSGDFYVGYSSSLGNKYFDGTMDDFQVYNIALTQTAVTNLYSGGNPTEISSDTTGLIAYWKMNGTSTTGPSSIIDSQTSETNAGQLGANTISEADDPTTGATGKVGESLPATDTTSTLTISASINESNVIELNSTANTLAEKVNVFDFTITDLGTSDGLSTDITKIDINTSGLADFSKMKWLLNGADASDVVGEYNSTADTITFTTSISVANDTNETYTLSTYFQNPTGLTDNQMFGLSIDDTGITVDTSKSSMSSGQTAITNSSNAKINIVATKLIFKTQPSNVGVN